MAIDNDEVRNVFPDQYAIRCLHCEQLFLINELWPKDGHSFADPKHNGGAIKTKYLHCFCQDPHAKLFDPGEGDGFELGANVELTEAVLCFR